MAQRWQRYTLDGETLEVLYEAGVWRLRLGGREAESRHVDEAFQQLLSVPSHAALPLALALLNAEPGTELVPRH